MGDKVKLTVVRGGNTMDLEVTLDQEETKTNSLTSRNSVSRTTATTITATARMAAARTARMAVTATTATAVACSIRSVCGKAGCAASYGNVRCAAFMPTAIRVAATR